MPTDLTELLQSIDEAIEQHSWKRALCLILENWNNLQDPAPLRERVALLLGTSGNKRRAAEVYDLVARHYANAGYPTRALAAIKQMQNLNPSSTQLLDQFTTLYSVRSPFLERDLSQPGLPDPVGPLEHDPDDEDTNPEKLLERAFRLATEPENTAERPGSLPALPLMSLLPPKALRQLLDCLEYEIYADSEPVVGPDNPEEALFWTVSSDLVVTDDDDPMRIPAGTLLGLNHFGSHPCPPDHTVVARPGSECLRLEASAIEELTDQFPDFPNRLATMYRHALTEGLLERHELFAPLDDDQLQKLPDQLTGLQLEDDVVLVRQNKISPGLYILLDGTVEIVRRREGDDVLIETLHPGEMFGEIGLIDPRPSPATIVTSGRAHVLFFDREQFIEFADKFPDVARVTTARARKKTDRIKSAL